MGRIVFRGGTIVLEDRLLAGGEVEVDGERIVAVRDRESDRSSAGTAVVDLRGGCLTPGYVDIHVHGGDNCDFMDGTEEAFRTICRAHMRHGTTSIVPTTTVARHDQHLAFLTVCRKLKREGTGGARILGAHFYGPYFAYEARGAHPGAYVRAPEPNEYQQYLEYADCIVTATVAPELPGAEGFIRACRAKNIVCNVGHSHATFEQVEAAVGWGVRHIDHLFCAMSDKTRLRQSQTYPMRGGVLEATLFFDELTTEVIADGMHLQRELLALAYKIKGPDRLALITDCNRALDMPDGDYLIGPLDGGERVIRRGMVCVMPDGKALGSSVVGMDHCVQTFLRLTGKPLPEVIRMATLTPARIAGRSSDLGSIAAGKLADLLVLDQDLDVQQVYQNGQRMHGGR